ncbi:hypothetical protein ACQP2F_15090 [Actinoplanes sp. CA-030573]|uniref:hypothetical protein n=1 Tax=Actinoplanes sp. CA-030573 TaxID=3239898 RepID=UPI003D940833
MAVVILDAVGLVVAADCSAERLVAVDGQAIRPGVAFVELESDARSWLVARREIADAKDGQRITFAHLAPLNVPERINARDNSSSSRANDGDYLFAVLECLDTGVMALDGELSPIVVNAALRNLHGYPAEACDGHWPGKPLVYHTDGSELADEERLIAMVLRDGQVRGLR